MKRHLLIIAILFACYSSLGAGGAVNFNNNALSLFTVVDPTHPEPTAISRPAGTFYFGLFTAPVGRTDLQQFTFSGLYATNLLPAGRLYAGTGTEVPDWEPGTYRNFFVAGWTVYHGHDWQPSWLLTAGNDPEAWSRVVPGDLLWFDVSEIGTVMATAPPTPPAALFGTASGQIAGLTLHAVPEPGAALLAAAGLVLLWFRKGCKTVR